MQDHGELYIQVIEGRDIVTDNDLLVSLALEGRHSSKNKTHRARSSTTPKWFSEFVFYLSKYEDKVNLSIEEYGLLSNRIIGTTSFSINDFLDLQINDFWIPIEKNGIQTGEMHLLAKFTPYYSEKEYSISLPSLRIQLERNCYYPGEILKGHVIYNASEAKSIKSINLEISGKSYVDWACGNHRCQSTYPIIDTKIEISGRDVNSNYKTFGPGIHVFPFEYNLPMDIPCSTSLKSIGSNRLIEYKCSANVKFRMKLFRERCNASFNIENAYESNSFLKTYMITGSKQRRFAKSQNITVVGSIPDIIYSDEITKARIKIINNGEIDIRSIDIKIAGHVVIGSQEGFILTHSIRKDIKVDHDFHKFLPLKPGSEIEGDIEIMLPYEYNPSINPEICPNFQIRHFFQVSAITEGNILTRTTAQLCRKIIVRRKNESLSRVFIPPDIPFSVPNQLRISEMNHNILYLPPSPKEWNKSILYIHPVLSSEEFNKNVRDVEQSSTGMKISFDVNRLLNKMEKQFKGKLSDFEILDYEPISRKEKNEIRMFDYSIQYDDKSFETLEFESEIPCIYPV